MKILKNSLFSLISHGYITLQIPSDFVYTTRDSLPPELEDVPDEWIMKVQNGRLALPSEKAYFLHLSPKGFLANQDKIKEIYTTAINGQWNRGKTWQDFEDYVSDFYTSIRNKTSDEAAIFQAKAQQLNNLFNAL